MFISALDHCTLYLKWTLEIQLYLKPSGKNSFRCQVNGNDSLLTVRLLLDPYNLKRPLFFVVGERGKQSRLRYSKNPHKRTSGLRTLRLKFGLKNPYTYEHIQPEK